MTLVSKTAFDGYTEGLVKEWTPTELGWTAIDLTTTGDKTAATIDLSGAKSVQISTTVTLDPSATAGDIDFKVDLLSQDGTNVRSQFTLWGTDPTTTTDGEVIVVTFGRGLALAASEGTVTSSTDGFFDCLGMVKLTPNVTTGNDAGTSATASIRVMAGY